MTTITKNQIRKFMEVRHPGAIFVKAQDAWTKPGRGWAMSATEAEAEAEAEGITKKVKTNFSDRGLTFNKAQEEYFYNGVKFETWTVSAENNVIGVYTWPVDTYPSCQLLSERFDPERKVIFMGLQP